MKRKYKKMLKQDIELCEYAINNPEKSCEIYDRVVAKYSAFDDTFSNGIKCVHSLDCNYTNEVKMIKYKLEGYLSIGHFPNETQGNSKTIYKYCNFGDQGQISNSKKLDISPQISLINKGEE